MQEFLDKLTGPNGGAIIGVVCSVGALAAIVATVALVQWRKHRQAQMDAAFARRVLDLKRQMVERGMSADEIERVLSAQPSTESPAIAGTSRHLQATPEYAG